jgi:hypothetical protein
MMKAKVPREDLPRIFPIWAPIRLVERVADQLMQLAIGDLLWPFRCIEKISALL